ncbi:MAG: zinc metalloprotease, partial [Nonomuraea muscovyensis]|nr:zinc metalloprotease [Nonomuraea muscovyensis]
MARRVTAVSLACLLAAGLIPPLPPDAAAAATGCASPSRPARPGPATPEDGGHGHHDALRLGPEPRTPYPADVGRVLAELDKRLQGREPPARVTVPVWVHILTDGVSGASTASV